MLGHEQTLKTLQKLRHVMVLSLFLLSLVVLDRLVAEDDNSFQLPLDASLIIKLKNLEKSQAPFVSNNLLFFTYAGSKQTKAVGIAFESENFTDLKMLKHNSHDVFIYVIPIPEEKHVAYRYWIDGLWDRDPANPNYYLDDYGVEISLYENNNSFLHRANNPVIVNGDYDFYAYFEPEQDVRILGNFNNWSPFMSPLEEIEPGKYYIRIKYLQPGDYQYYFWVGGFKHLDPMNHLIVVNREGERVSAFTVNRGN